MRNACKHETKEEVGVKIIPPTKCVKERERDSDQQSGQNIISLQIYVDKEG